MINVTPKELLTPKIKAQQVKTPMPLPVRPSSHINGMKTSQNGGAQQLIPAVKPSSTRIDISI
jgi:hypothetical protein